MLNYHATVARKFVWHCIAFESHECYAKNLLLIRKWLLAVDQDLECFSLLIFDLTDTHFFGLTVLLSSFFLLALLALLLLFLA